MTQFQFDLAMGATVAAIVWLALQLLDVQNPGVYLLIAFVAAQIESRTR